MVKKQSLITTPKTIPHLLVRPLHHFVAFASHNKKDAQKSNRRAISDHLGKSGEEGVSGRWTREEHERFLEALKLYGRNWKMVQMFVKTRTTTQTRSHAQKYFAKASKASSGAETFQPATAANSPLSKAETPLQDEAHGARKRDRKRGGRRRDEKKGAKIKIIENGIAEELPKQALTSQFQIESIEQNYVPVYDSFEHGGYLVQQDDLLSFQRPEEFEFDFDIFIPEAARPLEFPNNAPSSPHSIHDDAAVAFDFSNIAW